ncbi:flagellar assembly protein FliH [Metabacillus litoralis]|uniref:Flagellar assembly protein FliH n=1 Tax=Metabacillus litoralis TaxID=152268 RepID=A0A5C6W3N6_9BACI|nr:flagellar assembly protein FliH [Metabacillus litoralis]
MILLSRLIKSHFTRNTQDGRQISVQTLQDILSDKYKDVHDPEVSLQTSLIIQSANEEANRILKEAIEEKTRIMEQISHEKSSWEVEREQIYELTRQEGYAEGIELGRQESLKQYESIIFESQRIVDLAKSEYDEKIQMSENEILSLAIKVAEKVLNSTLVNDPESFLPIVKKALLEVKDYENIKIHIHPAYYEFVISRKNEIQALVTNSTDINIYANAELNETDCFIESAYGRIDISIDTQLDQLKKQLIEFLNRGDH